MFGTRGIQIDRTGFRTNDRDGAGGRQREESLRYYQCVRKARAGLAEFEIRPVVARDFCDMRDIRRDRIARRCSMTYQVTQLIYRERRLS